MLRSIKPWSGAFRLYSVLWDWRVFGSCDSKHVYNQVQGFLICWCESSTALRSHCTYSIFPWLCTHHRYFCIFISSLKAPDRPVLLLGALQGVMLSQEDLYSVSHARIRLFHASLLELEDPLGESLRAELELGVPIYDGNTETWMHKERFSSGSITCLWVYFIRMTLDKSI